MRCGDLRLKIRGADTILIKAENTRKTGEPAALCLIYGGTEKGRLLLTQKSRGEPFRSPAAGPPAHVRTVLETEQRRWIDALAGHHFRGKRSLRELIGDPSFTITRVKDEEHDGRTDVRLAFEYRFKQRDEPISENGSLLLSPQAHWAVRECQVHSEPRPRLWRSEEQGEFEFATGKDSYPEVRKARYRLRLDGAVAWSQGIVLDVREWAYRTIPEQEFRVETYVKLRTVPERRPGP